MYGVPSSASTGTEREVSLSLKRRRSAYARRQTVDALSAHGHAMTSTTSHVTDGRRSSRSSTGSANDHAFDPLQGQGQGPAPVHLSKTGSGRRSSKKLVHIGRTPSSSSVLLHKVREIIREKVFEASVDGGPDTAAVERERRQRAADAFEVQRRMQQQMTRKTSSAGGRPGSGEGVGVRGWTLLNDEPCGSGAVSASGSNVGMRSSLPRPRMRSDPARRLSNEQHSFERDYNGARLAFSQRSTSEDTYNRRQGDAMRRYHQGSNNAIGRKGSTTSTGGVTCYDDDLRAISFKYKPQSASTTSRSSSIPQQPRSSRASSLDAGQCTVFASFESLQMRTPSPKTSQAKLVLSAGVQKAPEVELPERDRAPIENEAGAAVKTAIDVREVEFDELGQTWDVYGAELDPEMLGDAIQTHLERIMKDRRRESVTIMPTITDCRHIGSDETINSLSLGDDRKLTNLCFFRYLCTSVQ